MLPPAADSGSQSLRTGLGAESSDEYSEMNAQGTLQKMGCKESKNQKPERAAASM